MFEQTRQHYLKQMGVTLWYSRCELPGAATSPEFLFGANLGGDVESEVYHPETHDSDGLRASIPKSAADILSTLSSKQETLSATGVVSPDVLPVNVNTTQAAQLADVITAKSTALATDSEMGASASKLLGKSNSNETFSVVSTQELMSEVTSSIVNIETLDLMLWVGEKNWFISDNDVEYPEPLKRQLLLNIASALGESIESTSVTYFRWPFFGNKRLPGNDSLSMLALLLEWLGERVASDSLTGFLMGEKIVNLLLQQSLSKLSGESLELNISDERGVKVVPTLPLNDLLREPLNKRVVWQHISAYRIK